MSPDQFSGAEYEIVYPCCGRTEQRPASLLFDPAVCSNCDKLCSKFAITSVPAFSFLNPNCILAKSLATPEMATRTLLEMMANRQELATAAVDEAEQALRFQSVESDSLVTRGVALVSSVVVGWPSLSTAAASLASPRSFSESKSRQTFQYLFVCVAPETQMGDFLRLRMNLAYALAGFGHEV